MLCVTEEGENEDILVMAEVLQKISLSYSEMFFQRI